MNFGLWAKDKHGNANKNVNDNANVNANLLRVMDNMVFITIIIRLLIT